MRVHFEVAGWDDFWQELVAAELRAEADLDRAEAEKAMDRADAAWLRAQDRLEAYEIWTTKTKVHAERLLTHLQPKFPKLRFGAHSDPRKITSDWRILVRTHSDRPLSRKALGNVIPVLEAILRNVEQKYPPEAGGAAKPAGIIRRLIGRLTRRAEP